MKRINQKKKYKYEIQILLACTLWLFIPIQLHAQGLHDQAIKLVSEMYESQSFRQLPDQPILNDYQMVLIANNPSIRAAYGKWQREVSKITAVRGLPDPRISFGYFIQNIETAVGPQEYKLGFSQMMPWPGKLFTQGAIQSVKSVSAYFNFQSLVQKTLLLLEQTYYDYYYLERAINVMQQNIGLVKSWEQVILARYKTDYAVHAHLIKSQIEVMQMEDQLKTLEAKQIPMIASFRDLLNLESLDRIHIPDSLAFSPASISKEEMRKNVLENNPDLKAVQLNLVAAEKSVSRSRMNYLPDFGVGVDYILTGDRFLSPGQPVPDSGKDPLVIMGSVNIPLWFSKQSGDVKAALHYKREMDSEVTRTENQIQTELEGIWFELEDAGRKTILYRDHLIPKSLESLNVLEKAYISEAIDFLNLIDAQRRYLQFKLAYEYELVRYYKNTARLHAITGRIL